MRKRLSALIGLPLIALIQASGPASAQGTAGAPVATAVGAPGTQPRNDAVFSVTARYDSNVPRLSDESLNLQGFEREDIRISPALQLNFARNLGRHQVGINANLGYDFYIRNTELNRERLSVEPFVYANLPVCDLAVAGLASRQQSDLGQLVYVGIDPTLGTDNTETRKRINGRLICGETYGLRPTLEVERGSGDNSNPLRQVADYHYTRIQPGVGYSSPVLGEIGIFAVKTETDLPNQILPNGETAGYTLRGFGLQYSRNIGSRLTFNGSVSHVEVTPYGNISDGESGLNASVNLTLLASERLQLTAFANRNFTSTLTSTSTYELAEGYGLTATVAANDRLRFRFGGQYSPRRFFYAVTPVGPFIAQQKQYDTFGGVSYTLNRRMRLNLDAGYQRRDADLDIFDYDSVYAAVGLSFSL